MSMFREALSNLGHILPPCATSVGRYAGHRLAGDQFWCVQGPLIGEDLAHQGIVGDDLTLEDAKAASRQVALNILAQLDIACAGDMDRVVAIIRLGGYINSAVGFTEHSKVMNAASDIFLDLFGDRGQHARFVSGCCSMPYNLSVEIEAVALLNQRGRQ